MLHGFFLEVSVICLFLSYSSVEVKPHHTLINHSTDFMIFYGITAKPL